MEGNFDFIARYYTKKIIMSHVRMVRSTSGADTSKMFLIITCRMFL